LSVDTTTGEESEGGFLSVAGAKDEGENPAILLLADDIEVGERQLACFNLLLDLGGVGVTTKGSQGIAGDEREPAVAAGGLLAGLDHDTRRFEFDEGMVGLSLVHRDVDDQAGWVYVVQV